MIIAIRPVPVPLRSKGPLRAEAIPTEAHTRASTPPPHHTSFVPSSLPPVEASRLRRGSDASSVRSAVSLLSRLSSIVNRLSSIFSDPLSARAFHPPASVFHLPLPSSVALHSSPSPSPGSSPGPRVTPSGGIGVTVRVCTPKRAWVANTHHTAVQPASEANIYNAVPMLMPGDVSPSYSFPTRLRSHQRRPFTPRNIHHTKAAPNHL